jgi:hypothetical protein
MARDFVNMNKFRTVPEKFFAGKLSDEEYSGEELSGHHLGQVPIENSWAPKLLVSHFVKVCRSESLRAEILHERALLVVINCEIY